MVANLGDAAATIAMGAAVEYLRKHDLTADCGALAECLKAHIRIQLPTAMKDAKDALDIGMREAANATFAASMALAGIEAAKEAGLPRALHLTENDRAWATKLAELAFAAGERKQLLEQLHEARVSRARLAAIEPLVMADIGRPFAI